MPVLIKEVRVVMEKHGELANLRDMGAPLVFNPVGSCKIMDLAYTDARAQKKVDTVVNAALLPENCIYVMAPLDAQGKIQSQPIKLETTAIPYPAEIRLQFKGDGGFVPATTVGETWPRQYRSMKEAPADGYKNELVLDAKAIEEMTRSMAAAKPHAFFYVRVGKCFGKGELRTSNLGRGWLDVGITLRLQEDGTRNVATED